MNPDLDMSAFERFMWVEIRWNSLTHEWTVNLPDKIGVKTWTSSDVSMSEALIKAFANYLEATTK